MVKNRVLTSWSSKSTPQTRLYQPLSVLLGGKRQLKFQGCLCGTTSPVPPRFTQSLYGSMSCCLPSSQSLLHNHRACPSHYFAFPVAVSPTHAEYLGGCSPKTIVLLKKLSTSYPALLISSPLFFHSLSLHMPRMTPSLATWTMNRTW